MPRVAPQISQNVWFGRANAWPLGHVDAGGAGAGGIGSTGGEIGLPQVPQKRDVEFSAAWPFGHTGNMLAIESPADLTGRPRNVGTGRPPVRRCDNSDHPRALRRAGASAVW
jgi:hypothetical protein